MTLQEMALKCFDDWFQTDQRTALSDHIEEALRVVIAEEREACALAVWDAELPSTNETFNLLDVRAAMARQIRKRSTD